MKTKQQPCPRCGSNDIQYKEGRCLCGHRPSCWEYPVCRRCGYTNGQSVANSDGTVWYLEGMRTFGGGEALSLDITEEVQKQINDYDSSK